MSGVRISARGLSDRWQTRLHAQSFRHGLGSNLGPHDQIGQAGQSCTRRAKLRGAGTLGVSRGVTASLVANERGRNNFPKCHPNRG